ncbi:PREDICTED: serine protease SP24D-like [Bactrocera latifrons]|uniref:Serine protease SP24D n=1 Tax=Bactrocera latifrons TaxID=174628 RepID=A0A0K8U5Z8_BACLA|nr:PREDICTED: serine protease SP24D-like [Bactrocera latifrons]
MVKFELFALICLLGVAISLAVPTTRVVGGDEAYEGQFPHQISLRRSGSHTCGGSILSRYYVLTAAHCVGTIDAQGNYSTYDPSLFTVRAGSTDRLRGGVLVNVQSILTHENYGNFLNDVSLLRLRNPLIYSQNIQPARLATKEVPAGEPVIISGWGRVKQGGDIPQKLKWNTLSAISRSECRAAINWDSDALICLAHAPNNGACNGDSGGPAMYEGEVVGIAGFVYGGCGTGNPDGYAKVYYHVNWIKQHAEL